jgi:hypothetical protein
MRVEDIEQSPGGATRSGAWQPIVFSYHEATLRGMPLHIFHAMGVELHAHEGVEGFQRRPS